MHLSAGHAANRLQVAKELTGRWPGTLDLQERGEITGRHSRSPAEATLSLDQVTAGKMEQAVLPTAPDQTMASFRRNVKRALLQVAPQAAEQAHERGLTERRVVHTPSQAGMSGIWMLLPDARLLPAHGPTTLSTRNRIDELLDHHEERQTTTAEAVARRASTAFDVANELTWTRRHRRFDELDMAHLEVLTERGWLARSDVDGIAHFVHV